MALRLTDAVTDGIRRALTRTGLVVFAGFLASQLLLLSSINTVIAAAVPPEMTDVVGLTLPVSDSVAQAVLLGTYLFTSVFTVIVFRALSRPVGQLSTFPAELYTRRIGRATLSTLVGGVVVSVALLLGLLFFVIPGLFLAASFLFFPFAVAVEDRGVVGALRRSWSLSAGNRLKLLALVLLVGIGGFVVGVVPAAFQAGGAFVYSDATAVALNSVLFPFVYGITASAYLQVRGDDGDLGGSGTTPAADTALDPDR